MNPFPNSALLPREATPRITLEHAAEAIQAINKSGLYPTAPAIVIAVWTESLVKYLIDDEQVTETIRRLGEAAKEAGGDS